ncbi:D-2-hydroxyacid dehydrogenase [Pseudooceanicola sp. LIPI14-2-Ac024]|uniref:D-2-hydroxyacid dehydrogenase n=1 Tax=Pseudooceanicola sp. LIPI14-2-Ac024 TaxID=3344875 RepID=UPI0035D12786
MSLPKTLLFAPNADSFADAIRAIAPEAEILTAVDAESAIAQAEGIEVLVTMGAALTSDVLKAMPGLKWIQALSAGTDHIQRVEGLSEDIALTSLSGAHGPQMSELAIMMMLALPRKLRLTLENQAAHQWKRTNVTTMEGKTLCILGLGAISEALTARALPFGLTVTGVSDGRTEMPGVSRIYPYADLAKAAAEADFLCILSPLTERSRGIVNAEVLKALGPDGYLISMGRGPVVDEDALAAALTDGTIAGAGLDVFVTEPLPEESPFWAMENVIVTPHIGGLSDRYPQQAAPIVAGNLRAWADTGAAGLKNRVR